MTTEEYNEGKAIEKLLAPRYKVLAEDTTGKFKKGQTLVNVYGWKEMCWWDDKGINGYYVNNPENYPHLFRPMKWYEEREIKDMPKYMRLYDGRIREVEQYDEVNDEVFYFIKLDGDPWHQEYIYNCTPATLQQYTSHINNKPLTNGK